MVSSEERREVAERLRKYAKTVTHSPEYLWAHLEIAVNGWHMGAYVDESYVYDNEVLSRLADLIDPTCEVVGDNTYTSDYDFRCKTCGEHFSAASTPRYCPGCGRRIDYGDR